MAERSEAKRLETIYGLHAVLELIRAERRACHSLWIADTRSAGVDTICDEANARRIPIHRVPRTELDRRCREGNHQGIVASVDPYPYQAIETVLETAMADPKGAFLVALDQIQDPHNFGAMVRTALGCGVHGLITTKHESVGVTPAVVRASAGATEWLSIVQVTNLHNAIRLLKSKNIWVVGLDGEAKASIYQYEFRGGHAIVMGAEGVGLRRLIKETCDTVCVIPIAGPVDSYNVSVACAMTLGEAMRQRLAN